MVPDAPHNSYLVNILAAIVESSDDAIIGKTLDGIVTSWNKGAERIYGYKAEEVLGLSLLLIFPKDRHEELHQILEKIKHGERIDHYETVRVRKDGKLIYVSITVSPIKDEEGKIFGASTISRDISLQKSYEMALRRSEEKYRRIVDISAEGILVLDEKGAATFANKKLAELLGYNIEEIIGKNITEFVDEEDKGCLVWVKSKNIAGENVQFDFRFRRKDGSYIWTIVPTSPIFDEGKKYVGALFMISDITEHKTIEKTLRLIEARYRAILDSQTELICRYRPDFTLTFANIAFCEYFGVKGDEITRYNFLKFLSQEDHNKFTDSVALLSPLKPAITIESHVTVPGGEKKWQQWSHLAIFDDMGRFIELQSVGRDTTERKQAEEALSEAKQQAELYLDLMGHDINNMNQIALGYLEVALESFKLDQEEREFLKKPLDTLKSSAKLIANVRKLQKLEEGGLKYREVDLCAILAEVIADYSHVPDRDVIIDFKPIPGCFIVANELVSDVFSNLISNSIKHSDPHRPLSINIRLEQVTEKGADYYRVTVEDDGPGIPDDLKNKLFMRFQRGQTKAIGKGLGLYLVRTLVNDFRGKIWVEDRVKGDHTKGARFVVMLPSAEQ